MAVDHDAPHLAQHAPRGRHVPRVGAALPPAVELARGDAADGLGGAVGGAEGVGEAAGGRCEGGEDGEVEGEVGPVAVAAEVDADAGVAEATGQRAVVERESLGLPGVERGVLVPGAAAAVRDGGEEFALEGVVDDADGGPPGDDERERDADLGQAVEEVGGAVDGVDDPGGRRGDAFFGRVEGLLADELVLGVFGDQARGDEVLDRFVGVGDDVRG